MIEARMTSRRRSAEDQKRDRARRTQLKEGIRETEGRVAECRDVATAVRAACGAWRDVQTCPVCGATDPRRDVRERTFWCECQECGAQWGTRQCGACRQTVAVVLPYSARWEAWLRQGRDAAVLAGSDLLSAPVLTESGRIEYRCAACGDTC